MSPRKSNYLEQASVKSCSSAVSESDRKPFAYYPYSKLGSKITEGWDGEQSVPVARPRVEFVLRCRDRVGRPSEAPLRLAHMCVLLL